MSTPLQEAFSGHWLSQAIFTLHRLGVPGPLQQQPYSLADLAERLSVDARSLWQVLEIAKILDAVEQDGEGAYRLTTQGLRLLPEREDSFIPFIDHLLSGYTAWGELAHSVKTGGPAFAQIHGMDIYDFLARRPAQNTFFNRYMAQTTDTWLAQAGRHYDFEGRVIDLGGNKGALSALLLQQFPALRSTVFDLEHAVQQAPPVLEAAGVADRCHLVVGSFFAADSIPTNGDIYLLSRVLLNWNDAQAVEILRNCRQAMPTGSKLLILEIILSEQAGLNDYLSSLNLLVMFGARLRSHAEFESLLAQAGFVHPRWIPAGFGENPLFYLEATLA